MSVRAVAGEIVPLAGTEPARLVAEIAAVRATDGIPLVGDGRRAPRHWIEMCRAAEAAGRRPDEAWASLTSGITVGATPERTLPRFRPLFENGTLTGGNSCRISDGAAAVFVAPGTVSAPGLVLRSHAVVGCDPALPGLGAAPAIATALDCARFAVADVAAFEVVEAFAAQVLAVLGELGLDDDDPRVCADGGAIALGHPWGASGAASVVRLFSRLVRSGDPAGTIGVAAASIEGGIGIAAVFEVVR